jgi:hypothetical protein
VTKNLLKVLYLSVLMFLSVAAGHIMFNAKEQGPGVSHFKYISESDRAQTEKDVDVLVSQLNKKKQDVITKLEQDGLSPAQVEEFLPIAMKSNCPLENLSCGGYMCPVPGPFCLCSSGEGFEFDR